MTSDDAVCVRCEDAYNAVADLGDDADPIVLDQWVVAIAALESLK